MKREIIKEAVPVRKISLEERRTTFKEVVIGYSEEEAIAEAKRCLQCPNKPCVEACPLHIDIPEFIKLIAKGKFEEALAKVKEKNEFPAITGRVCPQELLCQKACTLGKIGEPVSIGKLERFIGDYELKRGLRVPPIKAKSGKKIAVVGSGPAGLMVAIELAKLGHKVTIFEALHKPGGVLTYGVPNFRLPKDVVEAYINYVKELGVEIRVDSVIGRLYTIDELLETYDAVFIGTGAGTPKFLGIPGENLNGVYSANEFLIRVNLMRANEFPEYDTPIKVGKRVAVIGGGNVAMDAARVALRLGAEEVTVIYRRTEKEMPARREEIENAKEEGVKFVFLAQPVEFIGDESGWIRKVKCVRMRLGEPDETGRRRPIPIPGSELLIDVDTVVIAIGARVNPLIQRTCPNLKVRRNGTIVTDERGRTSIKRVYAAGDVVTGAATVIEALATGREVAKTIHKDLTEGT